MMEADSFDEAYDKAERFIRENEICAPYENLFGKQVVREVVTFADCFSVYDNDDVIEVYSSIVKPSEGLNEETIVAVHEMNSTRRDLLPLREFADPEHPEELEE